METKITQEAGGGTPEPARQDIHLTREGLTEPVLDLSKATPLDSGWDGTVFRSGDQVWKVYHSLTREMVERYQALTERAIDLLHRRPLVYRDSPGLSVKVEVTPLLSIGRDIQGRVVAICPYVSGPLCWQSCSPAEFRGEYYEIEGVVSDKGVAIVDRFLAGSKGNFQEYRAFHDLRTILGNDHIEYDPRNVKAGVDEADSSLRLIITDLCMVVHGL